MKHPPLINAFTHEIAKQAIRNVMYLSETDRR